MKDIVRAIAKKESFPCSAIQEIEGSVSHAVYVVDERYILRIAQDHSAQRFLDEQAVVSAIHTTVRAPRIVTVDEIENNGQRVAYSVVEFQPGKSLAHAWPDASEKQHEEYIEKLAYQLRALHTFTTERLPTFTNASPFAERKITQVRLWLEMAKHNTMPENVIDDLSHRFEELHTLYTDDQPQVLLHTDLNFSNILVTDSSDIVLLDFEWTMIGPPAYELRTFFTFALTPTAFLSSQLHEHYSSPVRFIHLLRKHYPALFDIADFDKHMQLYMMEALLWAWSDSAAALENPDYKARVQQESLQIYEAVFEKNVIDDLLS